MQLWQKVMIFLATQAGVKKFMESHPAGSALAGRFCGGRTSAAAACTARRLKSRGRRASFFCLGEYVTEPDVIRATVQELEQVIIAADGMGLERHLSVDPTQVGLMLGYAECRRNLIRLAGLIPTTVGEGEKNVLMIDMEDSSVTGPTLDLYRELAGAGLPVAVTLQACLFRTPAELDAIMTGPAMVRLVKGAFAEGPAIAWTGKPHIDKAYLELARRMLSFDTISQGFYPVFATHDHRMTATITELAHLNGVSKQAFEFEMLYGVRPDLEQKLVDKGYRVRLYLPFGRDFWPYAVRRIGENPRHLKFLMSSLTHSR